jgi:hypothetical protein
MWEGCSSFNIPSGVRAALGVTMSACTGFSVLGQVSTQVRDGCKCDSSAHGVVYLLTAAIWNSS